MAIKKIYFKLYKHSNSKTINPEMFFFLKFYFLVSEAVRSFNNFANALFNFEC
jgi:hypothetical protein